MEPQTKTQRGGRRGPLPRLTIIIPNFRRYQTEVRRREWVRVQAGIGRDPKMRQACAHNLNALAVFVVLLTLADNEGVIRGVTVKDLAYEVCGCDQRTVSRCLDRLAEAGLIKPRANHGQTKGIPSANHSQTIGKPLEHEQSSDDADLSTHTRDKGQGTEIEGERGETGTESAGEVHASPLAPPSTVAPTVDAHGMIVQALQSARAPFEGPDPIIGYRAKAAKLLTCRADIDPATYANWACMAIAAAASHEPDKFWVTVMSALKDSRMAGAFIPPEAPRARRRSAPAPDSAEAAKIRQQFAEYERLGV
jgi:hypothetical protein